MQLVCMMATPTVNSPQSPANSNNSDGQQPLTVNAQVTFYTKTQANGKGKKVRTGITKEMITKEFVHLFVNDEVNYCYTFGLSIRLPHSQTNSVTDPSVTPAHKVDSGLKDLQTRARRILAERNAEKAEENTWIGRMVAARSIEELDGLIKSRAA